MSGAMCAAARPGSGDPRTSGPLLTPSRRLGSNFSPSFPWRSRPWSGAEYSVFLLPQAPLCLHACGHAHMSSTDGAVGRRKLHGYPPVPGPLGPVGFQPSQLASWDFSRAYHRLGNILAKDDHTREGVWPQVPVQSRIVPAPPVWKSERRM